jgi:hypothetical protein
MKTIRQCLPWLLFLVPFVAAEAQETDLKQYSGYVNLEEIKIPEKAGEVTEITLGPALLKLAAKTSEEGDENLTKALGGILGIQVKTFEIDSAEAESIQPIMDKIEANLNRDGWERLIQVKGKNERTVVSIKYDNDKTAGLFIMSVEPGDEASFVNIVGSIDLNTIGNLGIDLDDSTLDSLKDTLEGK